MSTVLDPPLFCIEEVRPSPETIAFQLHFSLGISFTFPVPIIKPVLKIVLNVQFCVPDCHVALFQTLPERSKSEIKLITFR